MSAAQATRRSRFIGLALQCFALLGTLAPSALAQSTPAKPQVVGGVSTLAAPQAADGVPAVLEGKPEGEPTSFTIENSRNVRDPFRRPPSKLAAGFDEGGNVPELERHEIDKFKLVGVITGPKKNNALLTDPNGKMHVVTEGFAIGTRHGLIKRIGPGLISIEEKVVNVLGQEEKVESYIEFDDEKENKGTQ